MLASPGRPREVWDALEAAQKQDLGQALAVSRSLLMGGGHHDWAVWYVRLLALRAEGLSARELELLDTIETPILRQEVDGLQTYLAGPAEDRESVARQLLTAWPDSALAHALLASALFRGDRPKEAIEEAREALSIDPQMFLAARVELAALDRMKDRAEKERRSCEVLQAFPQDTYLSGQAITACTASDRPERLREIFLPVIVARRRDEIAEVALHQLIVEAREVPGDTVNALLKALDPRDRFWWPMATALFRALDPSSGSIDSARAMAFLETFLVEVQSGSEPSDEAVRLASLARSKFLETSGRADRALESLVATMPRLFPLHRVEHLRRIAELSDRMGHEGLSRDSSLDAFLLEHPYEPAPAALRSGVTDDDLASRIETLFPRLPAIEMMGRDGSPRLLPARSSRPRLLFFLDSQCVWAKKEMNRLNEGLRRTDHPFRRHGVEMLWIHRTPADSSRVAEAEIAVPSDRIWWLTGRGRTVVEREMRVEGSPWLFLVAPDGRIVMEISGYSDEEWIPRAAAILDNMNTPL